MSANVRNAAWLIVAAAVCAPQAPAWAGGELTASLGHTFGISPGFQGGFDQGGLSASLGVLWPWSRFRFGVTAFAADIGNKLEHVVLEDESGGPPLDYGNVETGHIGSYGGVWRVDATGPSLGRRFGTFATGSYGVYRLQADVQGDVVAARSALGGALGAGVDCALGDRHALALVGLWNRVANEQVVQQFANVNVEWRWRW